MGIKANVNMSSGNPKNHADRFFRQAPTARAHRPCQVVWPTSCSVNLSDFIRSLPI